MERKYEQVQMKYVKWVLGLESSTPNYVVLDETKRDELRVKAGRREDKEMLYGCIRDTKMRERPDRRKEKWKVKRK